jgi:DNA-directed RNA polymerase subunit beta'
LKQADINGLYSSLGQINSKISAAILRKLPPSELSSLRAGFYDAAKAVVGAGVPYGSKKEKGLLNQIHGSSPKHGLFQAGLLNKRQDLTMRSTIIPEPALGLDEIGIPEAAAHKLFAPFTVRKMVQSGLAKHPLEAQKLIAQKDKRARIALEKVMEEKPIIAKRDPALHKYSVQAFKPRLTSGKAIRIHPLVTTGFNADFDGDTMSMYVPITAESEEEARKMMPSNNLFSNATGRLMYQPTHESALGLYKLTLTGKKTNKHFRNAADAIAAAQQRKVSTTDIISVGGMGKTTVGRIALSMGTPKHLQKRVLNDFSMVLDKKGLNSFLTKIAKASDSPHPGTRGTYGTYVNKLKDIGNGMVSGSLPIMYDEKPGINAFNPKKKVVIPTAAHTLTLNDFTPDTKLRDKVIKETQKKVDAISKGKGTKAEKDSRAIALWMDADKKIAKAHMAKMKKNPTNLALMLMSGGRPNYLQYKQLVLSPMLVQDTTGKTVPMPLTKSFSEGQDSAGYWIGMYGARRGAVRKVQEVQEPGVITKALQNTSMSTIVTPDDCGATGGVKMSIHDESIEGRILAKDFKHGKFHVPAGTTLNADIMQQIKRANKNAVPEVRPALKCFHENGVCQKCLGNGPDGKPYPVGTNIGVISSHTLGEKITQLMLNSFHTGGVASGKKDPFKEFVNTVNMNIPNRATIAAKDGVITKVEKGKVGTTVFVDNKPHFVGRDTSGLHLDTFVPGHDKMPHYQPWKPPKVGMKVQAGQPLSDPNRTTVHPQDLYAATKNIDKVRNHMSNHLYSLYKDQGVPRMPIDIVVGAMTSAAEIEDPGDHPELVRGDYKNTSWLKAQNKQLKAAGKRPASFKPVLQGINVLPKYLREDWMANLQHNHLKDTIMDAAAKGSATNLHGPHPVPGAAYGAEFGLNTSHSHKMQYQHLKNVPSYMY